MDTLTKRIWLARLIALVLMAFGLSLLVTRSLREGGPYTHTVRVKVDGNAGEVLAAIEELNRPDVRVRWRKAPWYTRRLSPVSSTFVMTLSLTFSLGFCLGLHHAVYCAIWAVLSKVQGDNTLMDGSRPMVSCFIRW